MNDLDVFEESRRFLFGLAYRLLGTRAEAEDAVQDTYLKWREADHAAIDVPRAWLTSVCTRHCIDLMRAAQRTRVDYVGTWLPEPVELVDDATPERSVELASSLSTAFLLVLERLAPKERAAYLLREIFDMDYPEVAQAIGVQEAACRKLVSRARAGIAQVRIGHAPPPQRQEQLLGAFRSAIADGTIAPLAALLAEDVVLSADGGGKVPTLRETLHGRGTVLDFVSGALHDYWSGYEWHGTDLNGGRGAVLYQAGQAVAAVSFSWDGEGRASGIYIVRNPDKLARLRLAS
ncbi:MAG TPA: RNA polymerase sigma factor SigJ [Noviherbaspirillum sp.]|nr:RNA polymerase sigma factor SigJ [Noviherbaspirillum sp.]